MLSLAQLTHHSLMSHILIASKRTIHSSVRLLSYEPRRSAKSAHIENNGMNDLGEILDLSTEETTAEVEILKKRIGFVPPATTSISLGELSATVAESPSKAT